MSELVNSLKSFFLQSPITTGIVLLVILTVAIVFLWRSGWGLKKLKRIKLGPVEAERLESGDKRSDSSLQAPSNVATRDIDVQVANSTFHKSVGDIGGIITKVNSKEPKNS